jgi:hypothetical protein
MGFVGTTGFVFVVQLPTRVEEKTTEFWGRLKMSLMPHIFLFIAGEWCAVHP